ncbi:hypothetical protein BDB01DRAFT_769097 [Pilobolus umbonatus]|nr:hypothetical protein BDB01DRAFT_769097 [Pilobolus umbonatus]
MDNYDHINKEFYDVASFLEAQFGPVELDEQEKKIRVAMDGYEAIIDTIKLTVESDSDMLTKRIHDILNRIKSVIRPIPNEY